jgi:hypothetical protein
MFPRKRWEYNNERCFLFGPCRDVITEKSLEVSQCNSPCGGGIEYLHRDPASRRRRRKGKSQMWDSKIWSRDPRDSDQRKIALARASSIYKSQTRPLVREGAPQEDRNCHTSNKDLVVSPKWVPYTKTDWPADRRRNVKLNSTQTQLKLVSCNRVSLQRVVRESVKRELGRCSWRILTVKAVTRERLA